MTIKDAIESAKFELKECKNGSKIARILLCFHLGITHEELFLRNFENLSDINGYFALLKRYKNGEPLEYILGKVSFFSIEFDILTGVLIPRPETEILVEKILNLNPKNPKIAEIGTGSGIISVCLAQKLDCQITASDISLRALENADINAKKFGVDKKIKFINTSYLDGIDDEFDILVSNPPYIANDYKLDKWVQNEPRNALFGGKFGYEVLINIIKLASQRDIKILACEMGYDQKDILAKELEKDGFEAEFYKDLAGFDRGFVAYKM